MSYKDILVFLDGSLDNAVRVDFALLLAKAHGARLTGVDVNAAAAFEGEWAERAQSLKILCGPRPAGPVSLPGSGWPTDNQRSGATSIRTTPTCS